MPFGAIDTPSPALPRFAGEGAPARRGQIRQPRGSIHRSVELLASRLALSYRAGDGTQNVPDAANRIAEQVRNRVEQSYPPVSLFYRPIARLTCGSGGLTGR